MLLLLMMYTRRVWPLNEIRYMYSLHTNIIWHPNIYTIATYTLGDSYVNG